MSIGRRSAACYSIGFHEDGVVSALAVCRVLNRDEKVAAPHARVRDNGDKWLSHGAFRDYDMMHSCLYEERFLITG